MSERSAAIGLASAELPAHRRRTIRPAASTMNDQVTASTRPRAASARLALRVRILQRGQHGLARRVAARERSQRHAVDARDAHDLLDDIGLAFDVGAPGRHGDLHASRRRRRRRSRAARACASSRAAADRGRRGASLRRPGNRRCVSAIRRSPATHDLRRRRRRRGRAPCCGRELEARQHEGRIDAALEAIARIGIDAELAAGLRDVERIPQRRFDQHVGRRLRAAATPRRP